jgi:hypothetical protein
MATNIISPEVAPAPQEEDKTEPVYRIVDPLNRFPDFPELMEYFEWRNSLAAKYPRFSDSRQHLVEMMRFAYEDIQRKEHRAAITTWAIEKAVPGFAEELWSYFSGTNRLTRDEWSRVMDRLWRDELRDEILAALSYSGRPQLLDDEFFRMATAYREGNRDLFDEVISAMTRAGEIALRSSRNGLAMALACKQARAEGRLLRAHAEKAQQRRQKPEDFDHGPDQARAWRDYFFLEWVQEAKRVTHAAVADFIDRWTYDIRGSLANSFLDELVAEGKLKATFSASGVLVVTA